MAEKKTNEETIACPVGTFFRELENAFGRRSRFFEHMTQARVEFLKGLRSLIDERIAHLEKKDSKKPRKKMTKIRVE